MLCTPTICRQMIVCVWTRSRSLPTSTSCFRSTFKSLCVQNPNFSKTLTLEMVDPSKPKRPVCPSCSRPGRFCLCTRFKSPKLENSVSVTILQHSLEKKHPLNSARIAKLGLTNVSVAPVTDVLFEAQFLVHLLNSDSDVGGCQNVSGSLEFGERRENPEVESGIESKNHIVAFSLQRENAGNDLEHPEEKNDEFGDINGECRLGNDCNGEGNSRNCGAEAGFVQSLESSTSNDLVLETDDLTSIKQSACAKAACGLEVPQDHTFRNTDLDIVSDLPTVNEAVSNYKMKVGTGNRPLQLGLDPIGVVPRGNEEPFFTLSIAKYGVISSLTHQWMTKCQSQEPDFNQILSSSAAVDALAEGFVVKKLQKRQLNRRTMEFEWYEEFEVAVPPGSMLLFPSEKSIGVEDIDFDVKNLIVLDGTWAKAKRIYIENPWLKLLPHLKLDLGKMSMYSEVRLQPKAGYLSTIESIVYALKTVGDNTEGLDDLLDVFESMVVDQRQCREESLSKACAA
ncbi:uncharacterized protein LOC131163181 [Malania oleifera]|uniref:uncharacterized protein LOC131163181 n=1 Tax=Malania oleifera TaxID=397392 RepID=UPI0025AE78C6|nr:uncharacterized protein LOC131163181 [Malania oleifera]XP_057975867.1 uncharacterized protein LOC131163181 [Malania oleifera]